MNVLVMAAHPDDEVLGVGATIRKHVEAGDEVDVCIVTKAYEPDWSKIYISGKVAEQKKVDRAMGIYKRYNLGFPTVKLNTIPTGALNKKVMEIMDSSTPRIVYTHFEHDVNYDHTLVYRAVMVATRPPKRIEVRCFETLSETEWNDKPFLPNFWVENSLEQIEKKVEAFQVYASEVKDYPHPRSPDGIKILAMKRGSEVCVPYAEAFKIVRGYWI